MVAGKWEMETPKSASWFEGIGAVRKVGKRWEPERRSKVRSGTGRKPFDMRESCCCEQCRCECCSLMELDSGSSRACCGQRRWADEQRSPRTLSRCSSPPGEKRRSRSCGGSERKAEVCKGMFCSERDVRRVKRSLRLLGLELSDFGIYSGEVGEERTGLGWKGREQWPRFRTKLVRRSVSLERLRESVRQAWAEDELDESHRRLLARAVYEEWYFRKERELCNRREEEKIRRAKEKESLKEEIEKKKAKSEEEFEKWLQGKKGKRKDESKGKQEVKPLRVLMKSREEIEEAFLKWKKSKDEELERRKKERKKEEKKKMGLERQKAEKKATAEKAFLQWKNKLEENEKAEEAKRQKLKEKWAKMERRKKEDRERAISFQVWKEAKDQEIKQKMKSMRDAERAAQEERLTQMEERMYEAEQAFEDWLEKLDSRKHRQFCNINSYQKLTPWIPA